MKKKNILVLCISLALMTCLSACVNPLKMEQDAETSAIADGDSDKVAADESLSDESLSDEAVSEENISEEEAATENVQAIHVASGSFSEYNWDEDLMQSLAHVSYPMIQLDSCCAAEYLPLSKAFADLNAEVENSVLTEYVGMGEDARNHFLEDPEYFQMYETTEDLSVRRADSKVVSLLYEGYSYLGGVHGMSYYRGVVLDTVTGERLELTDVVADISKLPELIKIQLEKYTDSEELYPDLDVEEYIRTYSEDITWILDYNGITFFFDPYEIGPYASGAHVVTLSFAEYPELIKQEYQNVPKSYGVQLTDYTPFYYDLDGDSAADELLVYGMISEYDRIDTHVISINDNRYESGTDAYSIDPVFIHTAEGNYLYIQDTSDNDWRTITVYDLNKGIIENVGSVYAGWHTSLIEEADYLTLEHILTSPEAFRLDTHTDVLSTIYGYKNYRMDINGMPVSDESWYTFGEMRTFTLLRPISADIVDDITGEKIGETILEEGSQVSYYRTDNETFADLKQQDGTVVRIYIDDISWPRCVNGIAIEDIFDGMIFAG